MYRTRLKSMVLGKRGRLEALPEKLEKTGHCGKP